MRNKTHLNCQYSKPSVTDYIDGFVQRTNVVFEIPSKFLSIISTRVTGNKPIRGYSKVFRGLSRPPTDHVAYPRCSNNSLSGPSTEPRRLNKNVQLGRFTIKRVIMLPYIYIILVMWTVLL